MDFITINFEIVKISHTMESHPCSNMTPVHKVAAESEPHLPLGPGGHTVVVVGTTGP